MTAPPGSVDTVSGTDAEAAAPGAATVTAMSSRSPRSTSPAAAAGRRATTSTRSAPRSPRATSAEVAVAPVAVRQRAVNLIYAHPRGDRFEGAVIDELSELALRASEAYVRLIRQAKG